MQIGRVAITFFLIVAAAGTPRVAADVRIDGASPHDRGEPVMTPARVLELTRDIRVRRRDADIERTTANSRVDWNEESSYMFRRASLRRHIGRTEQDAATVTRWINEARLKRRTLRQRVDSLNAVAAEEQTYLPPRRPLEPLGAPGLSRRCMIGPCY